MKRVLFAFLFAFLCAKPALAAATYDTQACVSQAATNTTINITLTVANQTNRALVVLAGGGGVVNGAVSSVTDNGTPMATWTSVSSGAGTLMDGTVYVGIAPATGSVIVTVNWVGATAAPSAVCVYSIYNADQTAGNYTAVFRGTAGDLVMMGTNNSLAVSAHMDTFNNRAITGCTSSTDTSNYGSTGYSDAHCANTGSVTFTWADYGTVVVGIAANAPPYVAGGTVVHGLSMMGVGK